MINKKHKQAFSMVTAIFVIMVMSIVSVLIMDVTGQTLKSTTHQYQKEQAALLARSYTELAILYVMYYDRSSDCLENITDHFGDSSTGYDIDVRIKYIGNADLLAQCSAGSIVSILDQNSTGFYSTISLVVDTYIHYKDFDDPSDRDVTFHRRTLQKL